MGPGVAARQPRQRLLDLFQEGRRQSAGRHCAECVAIEAGVLARDPALLAADAHLHGAARLLEVAEHPARGDGLEAARLGLVHGEVAHGAQHVVEAVRVGRPGALAEPLEVGLHLFERGGVDQVAQLLLAEQLPQEVAVERQRGRAPLGVGRVALVHVGRDVVEQQRRGERRGPLGLHLHQRQLARVQAAQELLQSGQVEHVAQALAVGLEHDRKLPVALGHLEQRLGLQPLLPERGPLAGVGPREQERAGRVLAEAGAEQGGARQLLHDHLLDQVGLDHHELRARRLVGIGQVHDDAVVRPDGVGLEPELVADARR